MATNAKSNNYDNNTNAQSYAYSSPAGAVIQGLQGYGTADDPFLIETLEQFLMLKDPNIGAKGYYFLQTTDIDVGGIVAWSPIPVFKGYYNGNGYRIGHRGFEMFSFGFSKRPPARLFKNIIDGVIEQLNVKGLLLADKAINSVIANCKFDIDFFWENLFKEHVGLVELAENTKIKKTTLIGRIGRDNWHSEMYLFSVVTNATQKSVISDCVTKIDVVGLNGSNVFVLISMSTPNDFKLANNINASLDGAYADKSDPNGTFGMSVLASMLNQSHYIDTLQYDFDNIWEWDSKQGIVLQKGKIKSLLSVPVTSYSQSNNSNTQTLLAQQLKNNIWLS